MDNIDESTVAEQRLKLSVVADELRPHRRGVLEVSELEDVCMAVHELHDDDELDEDHTQNHQDHVHHRASLGAVTIADRDGEDDDDVPSSSSARKFPTTHSTQSTS